VKTSGKKLATFVALIGMVAIPLAACSSGSSSSSPTTTSSSSTRTTGVYGLTASYNPKAAAVNGSTDVYHCSLIDPKITQDSFVVSSEFLPGARKEVHHAIYFLIPPALIPRAQSLNAGGSGWSCFGAPLNPTGGFDGTPWLGGWAPGRGWNTTPVGTGIPIPAGSLIVMQIHYNLLRGTAPDNSKVKLVTVPAAGSKLKPLSLQQYVAPPDLPCPTGVTGPLCDRNASIADLVARTGPQAAEFLNGIEFICHSDHDINALQTQGTLVSTQCTWPIGHTETIRTITAHMHLLGVAQKVTLISGSTSKTLLNVTHYNFDSQISYPISPSVVVQPGDKLVVSCTYDPTLRQRNPQLRNLPPRYVTWGDGSSDEMCLAIVGATPN